MNNRHLHFSLFPAGGLETASSRIRIYTFQKALAKRSIQTTLGFSLKANVLLFQKKVTFRNLLQAHIARARGCVIIYDVDDSGYALWYWVSKHNFQEMLRIAKVVTTCSVMQREILAQEYKMGEKGIVISNTVDYFPENPVKLPQRARKKLRIVWFGNSNNFVLLEKYLKVLHQIHDSEVFAIVDARHIKKFSGKHPFVNFIPWSLHNFVPVLQDCDLACLMHDGNIHDMAKGNNKMISAITWGVPAVVSRTPEYLRTAQEAGIEYAVFSDETELSAVIERLRSPAARERYLQTAQPAIWSRYSPDVIAQQYIDLAAMCLKRVAGK
ncbi:MAG TPA: glycosyltransferase [Smithella sp.]|nr:glycosyltransferase [Smithella sp.]